jgi:hypothetical protein
VLRQVLLHPNRLGAFLVAGVLLAGAAGGWAYPLDGYPFTGIIRLEGYRLAQEGKVRARRQPPGALLRLDQVDLRLRDETDFEMPAVDPEFSQAIRKLLGQEDQRYGIAALDLTDLRQPRYGEHQGTYRANPGSVGKILVAVGLFQALADIYPTDIPARLDILRKTIVTADEFIVSDHHVVPFWEMQKDRVWHRPIQIGDRASLYTYLDWMLSASSNAAASMLMRELMLMVHFGREYPVGSQTAETFFKQTPRSELGEVLAGALQKPLSRNGLDLEQLRQGSFFTRRGKQLVPGVTSYATPRELMQLLVLLEQGRLVDVFSSREIKRLLYMTQRRIRYASSPALNDAAVYFKSGSLYKCQPEEGFKCRKYHGNVVNMLNSVAIVESPAEGRKLYYMVVVMSNVLRKNSAVAHQTLATRLQRLIQNYHDSR